MEEDSKPTAPKFKYGAYIERLREVMPRLRFEETVIGYIAEHPLLVFKRAAFDPETKEPIEPTAKVMLSAGVHGDEPAPPLAIARMANEKLFRHDVSWTIFPAMNPTGLELGTRENADGIDLNRDYKTRETYEVRCQTRYIELVAKAQIPWDLAVCLHEDYESTGFYLYQVDDTPLAEDTSRHMLARASEFIEIDESCEIDEMPAEGGIINPLKVYPDINQSRPDLPEAAYLFQDKAVRSFTTETPSSAYIEARISAQVASVIAAIETVCGNR